MISKIGVRTLNSQGMQDLKSCLMSAERSAVADGGMSYSAVQLSCVHKFLQENSDLNCARHYIHSTYLHSLISTYEAENETAT